MALIDQAALAADPTFQSQIRIAVLQYAGTTALTVTKTANSRADQKKYDLAASVLADGGAAATTRFAYAIASSAAFTFTPGSPPTATDANVKAAVIAGWPALAGVNTFDLS